MRAKRYILIIGLLLSSFLGYSDPPDPFGPPPPPPPGLPIDDWIWVLWAVAIVLAGYFHLKTHKKTQSEA